MTAVRGGNSITADLRTTVFGTVNAPGDFDLPENRRCIDAGFLRLRTWRGTFPPRPNYVEIGLKLRVDARPFAAR